MTAQVPLILNLETATEVCSVGLAQAGRQTGLCERAEGNDHGRIITRLIEECMEASGFVMSDLSAVAVSGGPGSYTSLRIGVSVAKGVCFALGLPLLAVDTLRSLAWAAARADGDREALYCPMIDARRMEVYTALFDYEGRQLLPVQPMVLDEPGFRSLLDQGKRLVFVGNGSEKCRPLLEGRDAAVLPVRCSAAHLAELSWRQFTEGGWEDLAGYSPNYLKAPHITRPAVRR
ncbi:MAG: tRNA ((37)-N6)-threonylcarbamoyltransferase complex dimerization subunit type 1 TsaB [Bacteroidota bacterium]|jgi:tRNA threonylcarbamoyladenosine biosynthesis protein TsaB